MKKLIIVQLVLLSISFFSCDPGSQIQYIVKNKSNSDLKLIIKEGRHSSAGASILKPNADTIVFERPSLGYSYDIIKDKKMDDFLMNLLITKDSIPIKTNIIDKANWETESIGDTLALYRFSVTDEDIK